MKHGSKIIVLLAVVSLSLFSFLPASAMDDPGFQIKRMVLCEKIIDREPVAIGDTFSAATKKIYSFLEAGNIEQDTMVSFVWYFENKELARVSLPLSEGRRWRTYSSKKIAGLKGEWKVELQDSSGIVLNTLSFKVQ